LLLSGFIITVLLVWIDEFVRKGLSNPEYFEFHMVSKRSLVPLALPLAAFACIINDIRKSWLKVYELVL
jgi:hypothetical protein